MHIKYERVDRDESKAFEDALAQLVTLRRIRANLAIYRYRVPVYRLLLSDVEKNKPELPAQPTAWRYFAGGKSLEHTVSGDVNLDAKHPVSNLTYGVAA